MQSRAYLPIRLLAVAVLLWATVLRTDHLWAWPPGISDDVAMDTVQISQMVRTGQFLFCTPDQSPEFLHRLIAAPLALAFGDSFFAFRMLSVYLGILAVAAAYRAARHMVNNSKLNVARLAGVTAAATLAIMVNHISLSRVMYRGIMLPFTLLMFVDAFLMAWRTRRIRHMAVAGAWLAAVLMSYTAGLPALVAAAIFTILEIAWLVVPSKDRLQTTRSLIRPVAAMCVAFFVVASPQIARTVCNPSIYFRAQDVARESGAGNLLKMLSVENLTRYAEAFYVEGDDNPHYNAAAAPLLHTAGLTILFLVGLGICIARIRVRGYALVLCLVVFMILPVIIAKEVNGQRISGEFGPVVLVIAAAVSGLANGAEWLRARLMPRVAVLVPLLLTTVLFGIVIVSGLQSWRLYSGFFTDAQPQLEYQGLKSLSWFFHLRERAIANQINKRDAVYYVPVDILNSPLRAMTLHAYPRITTFASYFSDPTSITLPAGRWLVSWRGIKPRMYAALMPDGTIVLLPWTGDVEINQLETRLVSGIVLTDPYGALAATVVVSEKPIKLPAPVAHKVDINFSDRVKIIGWDGQRDMSESSLNVLYFQRGNYASSVRLIRQLWDTNADKIGQGSENSLGGFFFAPQEWLPEDTFLLGINMAAPASTEPGAYQFIVGIVEEEGQHRLAVVNPNGQPGDDFAIVTKFKVPLASPALSGMQPAPAEFDGQIKLIGYQFLDSSGAPLVNPQPGEPVTLTLFWQALQQLDEDLTIFVHVEDWEHQIVAQSDV